MAVTISLFLVSVLFAALVIKLLSALQEYRKHFVAFSAFPGPSQTPYPLVGHAILFRGAPDETYTTLLKIIKNDIHGRGKDIGCIWMGTKPMVFIVGPHSAEVLLKSSQHMEKSFVYSFLQPWLGTGLLTSKGQKWKTRRKLLTPSFHYGILTEFLKSMNEQSATFTKKLDDCVESNEPFDIFKPIALCALDIICETAMGKTVHAQDHADSEYVKAVYSATDIIAERSKSPWLWMDIIFNALPVGKKFSKALRVLHDFTRSVIEDRMKKFTGKAESSSKTRLAFLDLLIEASDHGKVLSVDDIREEVDTFMFEGHDTTAAGMSWALQLIGSHPDVQRKIHKELDQVFDGDKHRPITPEDLRKLEYLEMVIKESLRILPSVPMIGRTTTSDCRIDGYQIPAGTECLIFLQTINKHSDYWETPEKFKPERFSSENSINRHPYAYIPFSAGPRNCIGQKFALMEEKVLLAHVLRKFNVTSCERTEDIRKRYSVLRPDVGILMKFDRR